MEITINFTVDLELLTRATGTIATEENMLDLVRAELNFVRGAGIHVVPELDPETGREIMPHARPQNESKLQSTPLEYVPIPNSKSGSRKEREEYIQNVLDSMRKR